MSMEEWRNHPDNPRNTPKISPELGQKIEDETLAQGVIWQVQEKINTRRMTELQSEPPLLHHLSQEEGTEDTGNRTAH